MYNLTPQPPPPPPPPHPQHNFSLYTVVLQVIEKVNILPPYL